MGLSPGFALLAMPLVLAGVGDGLADDTGGLDCSREMTAHLERVVRNEDPSGTADARVQLAECYYRAASEAQRDGRGCYDQTRLWKQFVDITPDGPKSDRRLEAYEAITACVEDDVYHKWVQDAFEDSQVLGVLPGLLEGIGVKEVVPILNTVRSKENKGLSDFFMIAELSAMQREASGGVPVEQTLLQELPLNPGHEPEVFYGFGLSQLRRGNRHKARELFRQGLGMEEGGYVRLQTVYVLGLAWPLVFVFVTLGLIWVAGVVTLRAKELEYLEEIDEVQGIKPGRSRFVILSVIAAVSLVATYHFVVFGHPAAFAGLFFGAIFASGWLVVWPMRPFLSERVTPLWKGLKSLLGGRLFLRFMQGINPSLQFTILVLTVFAFLGVTMIPNGDLRIAGMVVVPLIFFATVGSVILSMLQRSGSLRRSLWWLAAGASLPFLAFSLVAQWDGLIEPLKRGFAPSSVVINRALISVMFWFIGAAAAVMIGRIVARSIIDPLRRIDEAVKAIRLGDFDKTTNVERNDEIGELAGAVDEMAAGLRHRERLKRTLRRYVGRVIGDRLISDDTSIARPQRTRGTILFCDVRGFTTLSESMPPENVVEILNEHFARMEPIVDRWGGVVDKFIGDGMLAVWDIPERVGTYDGIAGERLACEAAIDMLEALEELNGILAERELPTLVLGIGINSGVVVAGPIGSAEREEYTVIGNTVNTAQRAESAAGAQAPILVTESVAEVVRPYATLAEMEPIPLKGKTKAVKLFQLVELTERIEKSAPLTEASGA